MAAAFGRAFNDEAMMRNYRRSNNDLAGWEVELNPYAKLDVTNVIPGCKASPACRPVSVH